MKNRILLVVFILCSVYGMGQTNADSTASRVTICFSPMAEFIGEGGFYKYMQVHTHYPEEEKKNGIQGTVYISFFVEADGSVTNVKEMKGIPGGPGLTAEAIRVISSMPKWKPMEENGKPIRVQMTQPVRFVLNDRIAKDSLTQKLISCGPQIPEDSLGSIFDFAERMPQYPGGWNAYLVQNLKYPPHGDGICTTVYVTFIVLEDGRLTNVQIKKYASGNCTPLEQAVLKVFCEMPPWQPGAFNNNPVKCRVSLPVRVDIQR